MIKIVKTQPRDYHPTFGYTRAQYGVTGRPDIRIVNDSQGWRCYGIGLGLIVESRKELEHQISKSLQS